jgi:hypothetical protein
MSRVKANSKAVNVKLNHSNDLSSEPVATMDVMSKSIQRIPVQ